MSARFDAVGNPVTAADHATIERLDEVIAGYLGARAGTRDRLAALLEDDPRCVMAHCLNGYLGMLVGRRDAIAGARGAWQGAAAAAEQGGASDRERMHLGALDAWTRGEMYEAAARWDALLASYPRDLVALKVSQYVLSYLGESQRMRETVERVLPAWGEPMDGFGFVLGCHAYALEEAGDYVRAEAAGRQAVEINRADIWAAHAVAHVAEMQGRLADGISWIASLVDAWDGCSTFANHLRWHEGLYQLELGRTDAVLALYDREVSARGSSDPLDITNAASLLWRLEQANAEVGARWGEIAERVRGRADEHALVFVNVHEAMALAAVGDDVGLERFLATAEHEAASGRGTEARVMAQVGLPLMRAAAAHRRGEYAAVVDLLLPIRTRVRAIGGSHAQRDVFAQMLIDAAWRSGRLDVAAELLAERTTQRPGNLWGWKHRALVLADAHALGADDARREYERLHAIQVGDA